MVNDSVADALIRLKNGYRANKEMVVLPYSKLVLAILKVLQAEGYIGEFKAVVDEKNKAFQMFNVTLRYENRKPVLTEVKRISKPGLRIYKGTKQLPWVLNGMGIALISTPKGVMTDKSARKEGLGGEIMALVW